MTAPFKLTFEKTYLHTDRDVYALGDTLWYKAYLVNAQDNKPAYSSGTLYVELIAPDSARILNREIIRLDNGTGNGDFALADTLKAGSYRLRAYTNWMRNFGDNFVFEKEITILNTQAAPVAPDPKTIVKNRAKNKPAIAVTLPAATGTPIIRFFPEGGSLVNGISSIVGVKAEDANGHGIPLSGAVLSAAGDTVSRFTCDSLGMGLFALLPIAGQSYHAVAGRDNYTFPSALSKGLTLQIRQTDTTIHAIVSSSDTTKVPCLLVVKHTGVTLLSQQLQVSRQLVLKIPTGNLPEGISAITLYDQQGKPECERLVYIHHPDKYQSKVSISTNKKSYASKEQTMVSITAAPNSSLSMAVVDADMVPVQPENIVAYFNLQSELRGTIENPNRYFDATNTNRAKQLDQLLLIQGWRDFVWRRMADTAIRISYAAEDGITVSGRIRDEVLNKMLPHLNLTLYAPGSKGTKLSAAQTDSMGRFSFGNLIFYGQQQVNLTAVNEKGQKKGSFMVDTLRPMPVLKQPVRHQSIASVVADSVAAIAIEKRSSMQRSKLSGVARLKQVNIAAKRSILTRNGSLLTSWGPDQLFDIKPEDEQYKTLEWYILQHAKGAVKSNLYYQKGVGYTATPVIDNRVPYPAIPITGLFFFGSDTIKRIINGPNGIIVLWQSKTTLIPPQLIVNGQELYMDDYDQAEAYRNIYFDMAITKFKRIAIKHMVGNLRGPGVPTGAQSISVDRFLIYLTLKDNALVDNPGSINAEVEGYYQSRAFYTPPPNAKPSLADYRSTIYWQPNIKTDATGKATVSFYNALPQTDVRVVVQGVSTDGKPVAAVINYSVKQPDQSK